MALPATANTPAMGMTSPPTGSRRAPSAPARKASQVEALDGIAPPRRSIHALHEAEDHEALSWPAAAPTAALMMTRVAGLIGLTPFLEGSLDRSEPPVVGVPERGEHLARPPLSR